MQATETFGELFEEDVHGKQGHEHGDDLEEVEGTHGEEGAAELDADYFKQCALFGLSTWLHFDACLRSSKVNVKPR